MAIDAAEEIPVGATSGMSRLTWDDTAPPASHADFDHGDDMDVDDASVGSDTDSIASNDTVVPLERNSSLIRRAGNTPQDGYGH